MINLRLKVAQGAAWVLAARITINIIGLISTITLARLLVPSDFGIVSIALTIIAIVDSFTNIRATAALIHQEEPTRQHIDTIWTISLIRGILISIIIALISFPASKIYNEPRIVPILLILAAANVITGAYNPKLAILNKNLVFSRDFYISVASKISGLLVAAYIAWEYKSYWALISASLVSQFVTLVFGYISAPYCPKFTLSKFKDFYSFSAWLTLSQSVITINWNADQFIAGIVLNHNELGNYNFANNLASLPTREAIQPLTSTLFPGFTHLAKDRDRLKDAYLRSSAVVFGISLPVAVGFSFLSGDLVPLVVGPQWTIASKMIGVMALIFGLGSISTSVQPLMMAVGATKNLFFRELFMLIVRMPLLAAGVMFAGIWGLIAARAASTLVSVLIDLQMVSGTLRLSLWRQLYSAVRYATASVIMWVMLSATKWLYLFFGINNQFAYISSSIAVGAVTYFVSSFSIWLLASKPEGVEDEIVKLLLKLQKPK